ncbi:branched chain amino acid/phenylalanine ABC transporter ATP binding subunit LivG [Desulfovibrionales bacterium]
MEYLLSISGLSKRFGGIQALTDVSFDVPKDRIQGLIGPNGAGKTTMFNCITGVYKPTTGDILFQPQKHILRINGLIPEKITYLGIARTFQNIRLFTSLTVLDNVRIGRHCRMQAGFFSSVLRTRTQRIEEAQVVEDAMRWLSFVGLTRMAFDAAGNLAYGDQRRLEIARALASEPAILLLDEPAAGMNPTETAQLKELIHAIVDAGITVILIEHDMKLVMTICEHLVVLDHGLRIAQGSPDEIRSDPAVIEAYLGRGAAHA